MFANPWLLRLFPFLAWFPINSTILRGDLLAGITGGLVLVPKAMAYAQLSGLPVYFGLYTAFVPAIVAALWGSSRQLLSGPVAIVSLMTAAAVTPLAIPQTEEYIGLALLLTLLVGAIQFTLGAIKLGTIVNFVSHPVILGFMNAAAIIIGMSQLDMLLGIPKGRSDSFLADMWEMAGYLPQTHLPTLAMSVFALAMMLALKKVPALAKPSVLVVVVITVVVSYAIGFEHKGKGTIEQIADPATRELVTSYAATGQQIKEISVSVTEKSTKLRAAEKANDVRAAADLRHDIDLARFNQDTLEKQNKARLAKINRLHFERSVVHEGATPQLYIIGSVPAGVETDGRNWHIKKVEKGEIALKGGGDVVGNIPAGLPSFRLPALSLDAILSLVAAAVVIALVAFMESISMAKAIVAKTRDKLDPNQELIGQGMANIGGAFFQSYPSCGSFTGSAINLQAGAKTGFASVFNGVFVAVTLLFLTPYLYHLPKAVLAVIILLAVTGLVTPQALKHTWQASRVDGVVALVTFVVTLIAAPHLDKGIMVGAGLALVLFLYNTMKPRVAILGRYSDGTLRDAKINNLPPSKVVTVVRFDGRLYFANVSYFEDTVLNAVAENPEAPYLLIVADDLGFQSQPDLPGEKAVPRIDGLEVRPGPRRLAVRRGGDDKTMHLLE